jgi:hypothetical protein
MGPCYAKNTLNLGLVAKQSLDILKDRKGSILPQTTHNLMLIKGIELIYTYTLNPYS